MPRVFALSDLHLSQAGHKPMDVFGELWRDHARRMAAAWDARVGPQDTVLLGGDLSWARKLEEAAPDLAWIAERPGRKLLLRGNHDGWWRSADRVKQVLPEGCALLQNDAVQLDPWVVVGARGWLSPDDPQAGDSDRAVYRRELERLALSIDFADRHFGRSQPRLGLVHYPPRLSGAPPSAVVEQLRAGGARIVVYGHLHGADHALALQGLQDDGLYYVFAAADAVDFTPVEIPGPERIGV